MRKNKKGFTLAEVLITLTVIGIVAAITIPALMSNIDERTWKTQKKALHVRLTNALMDMPTIGKFGEYKEETIDGNKVITDTAAEAFLVDGLSKYYKMTNICGAGQIEKCGLPAQINNLSGTKMDFPKNFSLSLYIGYYGTIKPAAAAFQTPNGESVAVYYNPDCTPLPNNVKNFYYKNRICVNFVYDLNGPKDPNQVGKDVGYITAVYTDKLNIVAPEFYQKGFSAAPFYSESGNDAQSMCKKEDKKLRLPTIEEMIALSANYSIGKPLSFNTGGYHWTSNILTPGNNGTVQTIDLNSVSDSSKFVYYDTKDKSHEFACVYE